MRKREWRWHVRIELEETKWIIIKWKRDQENKKDTGVVLSYYSTGTSWIFLIGTTLQTTELQARKIINTMWNKAGQAGQNVWVKSRWGRCLCLWQRERNSCPLHLCARSEMKSLGSQWTGQQLFKTQTPPADPQERSQKSNISAFLYDLRLGYFTCSYFSLQFFLFFFFYHFYHLFL